MKILAIGDLHGRKPEIHFKDFDAIVQVGDVCDDKKFRPHIKKWLKFLKKSEEKISLSAFLEKEIGKKNVKKLDRDSLIGGRKILRYLDSFNKPVFIVPGNWDQSYGETRIKNPDKSSYDYEKSFYDYWLGKNMNPRLIRGLKNIKDCQFKLHTFQGTNFIGYGLSSGPEDPELRKKSKKIKYEKGQYEKILRTHSTYMERLKGELKRKIKGPIVFISHNVPHNTKLDKVKNKNSPAHNKHLGSTVAREFCQKIKPLLCLSGHMHEYFGKDKIKNTTVINVGFGKNANVLVELDPEKNKIRKIMFNKSYRG